MTIDEVLQQARECGSKKPMSVPDNLGSGTHPVWRSFCSTGLSGDAQLDTI